MNLPRAKYWVSYLQLYREIVRSTQSETAEQNFLDWTCGAVLDLALDFRFREY